MRVEQWPGFWSAMRASTSASETEAPRAMKSSQPYTLALPSPTPSLTLGDTLSPQTTMAVRSLRSPRILRILSSCFWPSTTTMRALECLRMYLHASGSLVV